MTISSRKCFKYVCSENFVPKCLEVTREHVELLNNFLRQHGKIVVLTGAGVSTESGIPDYRSEGVGLYARSNHQPVQYQQFIKHHFVRKRYWARNFIGWPRFSNIQPNVAHYFLAELEQKSQKIKGLVTQNVDRLHQKAGSKLVTELHGSAFIVKCIKCSFQSSRADFQNILAELNPGMQETETFMRPDGDVELDNTVVDQFNIPYCVHCNGILKPDIVFFGDNVPKARVEYIQNLVQQSDSLLVLGSTISVYSAYRILLQAKQLNKFIVIVNIGSTRADSICNLKIEGKCGDIITKLDV